MTHCNVNRRSKPQSEFAFGNNIICDTYEIANPFIFKFFYILLQLIQPTHNFDHYFYGNTLSRFKFHSVNQDYIGQLIDNLKNKTSYKHDNISNELIKCAKEVFIEKLILLVNQMLKSGHFLLKLKLSKVKPFFKKGGSF